jgi:hypothetical protein
MKKLSLLVILLTLTVAASAQNFKSLLASELKSANMENATALLGLPNDPNSAFGKAYGKFNDLMLANTEKRFGIIEKFAKNYKNITPEVAKGLIKETVAFGKERNKLMAKMPKLFGKHLSPENLLSLMQYENKKQSIIDGFLARNIPFANQR